MAENTTAATQSTTESKSQDTQQSTTEQQAAATQAASTTEDTVDTQAVGADGNEEIFEDTDASADYSECLSLDNYTYLESPDGDYTFYYPQNVYNYAYYDGDSCIFTSDDENDTVKFIRKDNTSGSPAREWKICIIPIRICLKKKRFYSERKRTNVDLPEAY